MKQEEFKFKKEVINEITHQLKSHYYEDFFIDPDKKFISLLEKIIVNIP
jgi:hypothetical protein